MPAMKKLASTNYSATAFNVSMFLLRVCFGGILLFKHGMDKLQNFQKYESGFYNFLGMGTKTSLTLAIFAEVFCSLFVIIGLFTRLTVIPLIIMFLVIIFGANSGMPFLNSAGSELSVLYLCIFLAILFCGPGKISVDGMMSK